MTTSEKDRQVCIELMVSIDRLTSSVISLQNTIELCYLEEEETPSLLKRQAH